MKDLKLSFPYPSTSRHNLSQDIATSLSMGLVVPVRTVEVLPGDSHRIKTSFSLISNPLVKPLLQGVNMRYCRFWVPSRIYHLAQRANNANFDPLNAPVRYGEITNFAVPVIDGDTSTSFYTRVQQSSLFDYLRIGSLFANPTLDKSIAPDRQTLMDHVFSFNAEPYLAYIDICRNYFADSANGSIAWSCRGASSSGVNGTRLFTCISPLSDVDYYIDSVQNSTDSVRPYNYSSVADATNSAVFEPFILSQGYLTPELSPVDMPASNFDFVSFGTSHNCLCVPVMRPDRLSRLFSTKTLTSQNVKVNPVEITISNLSFMAKLQRYLTRRFFGGSRFTDVMYSVFGQKVPHVDTPVLLDVFDFELGTDLVASTNADATKNPGVLGGYFSSAGTLSTRRGRRSRLYRFNERGYIMDVVYIAPRVFRTSFVPDYYGISIESNGNRTMSQGNFVPDFNGIGWQQPSFVSSYFQINKPTAEGGLPVYGAPVGFSSEPSWQQYRTLPDVCSGAMNPVNGVVSYSSSFVPVGGRLVNVNSPIFTFTDRMSGNTAYILDNSRSDYGRRLLAQHMYIDFNEYGRIFGLDVVLQDNFFVVFRYAHQAKRQVTKRFTLNFA